jgi:hypothetical protein
VGEDAAHAVGSDVRDYRALVAVIVVVAVGAPVSAPELTVIPAPQLREEVGLNVPGPVAVAGELVFQCIGAVGSGDLAPAVGDRGVYQIAGS